MRYLKMPAFFRFSSLILSLLVIAALVIPVLAGTTSTTISGMSPYPDGGNPNDAQAVTQCNGTAQTGVVYRNSEAEPYLAVNPTNPSNMISAWHQDRWSNGAAQGLGAAYTMDGGATWTQVIIPFTRCAGALPRSAGDYERASDPWISFSPDGTAHFMALVVNSSDGNGNGMLAASSKDGGATWSAPVAIKASPAGDPVFVSPFHDKNSITADPFNSKLVYATWTLFLRGGTTLVFSRSTDGGKTWKTIPVDNMEVVGPADLVVFRQGAQVVVLPDGTLVNGFFRVLFNPSNGQVSLEQVIFRSTDQGKHWDKADTIISEMASATALDPDLGIPVRDAQELPDLAVNRQTGDLYLVWQDATFNNGLVGVAISHSSDGGLSWSAPVAVNTIPGVQAFLPAVAVAADGTVGVLYYDFRNDTLGDAVLSTDVYLAKFTPGLSPTGETRLTTASFDLRQAVITGSRGYFPGDYVGLDTAGNDFVAAYTVTNSLGLPVVFPQNNSVLSVDANNRQDIQFTRVTP